MTQIDKELWATFPDQPGDERTAWLLEQAHRKRITYGWTDIRHHVGGDEILIRVSDDAMKIGGVRFPVSAEEGQMLADMLDCVLLTAQLADLIHAQRAWTVPPFTRDPSKAPRGAMSTGAWTLEHSAKIDAHLASLGYGGRGGISSAGKHWILDPACTPDIACNEGWYGGEAPYQPDTRLAGPNVKLWQQSSFKHNRKHTDYSQTLMVADVRCWLNNREDDLRRIYTDKKLAYLVSHKGALPFTRQPGVPQLPVLFLGLLGPARAAPAGIDARQVASLAHATADAASIVPRAVIAARPRRYAGEPGKLGVHVVHLRAEPLPLRRASDPVATAVLAIDAHRRRVDEARPRGDPQRAVRAVLTRLVG